MTYAPESKPSEAQAITDPQNAIQDRKHRPAEEHK